MICVVSGVLVSQPGQRLVYLYLYLYLKEESRNCFVLSRVCWYHGEIRNFVFTETAEIVRHSATNTQIQKYIHTNTYYALVSWETHVT